MAIVAVMLVVGFSAFKVIEITETPKTTTATLDLELWRFTDNNPAQVTNPELYIEKPSNASPCDQFTDIICEIEAPKHPVTGEPMLDELVPDDPEDRTYADFIFEAMQSKTTNEVVKDFRSF